MSCPYGTWVCALFLDVTGVCQNLVSWVPNVLSLRYCDQSWQETNKRRYIESRYGIIFCQCEIRDTVTITFYTNFTKRGEISIVSIWTPLIIWELIPECQVDMESMTADFISNQLQSWSDFRTISYIDVDRERENVLQAELLKQRWPVMEYFYLFKVLK